MKTAIFYFSGTGNTWFVANKLNRILCQKGADSQLYSIEENELKNTEHILKIIKETDKIIIGYPIYGSKAPQIMEDFLYRLPVNKDKKSINVFTTVALYSGDGPVAYEYLFEKKGYVLQTAMEFIMNNNFNVPGFPDVLHVGDKRKIDKRHKKTIKRAEKMADRLLKNEVHLQGKNWFHRFIGRVQRKHVDTYIRKFNHSLLVSEDRCVHCNKCIKICPVDNISEINGKISFGDNCIACVRCYHQCPVKAINVTEKSCDTVKWQRFSGVYREFEKQLINKADKTQ